MIFKETRVLKDFAKTGEKISVLLPADKSHSSPMKSGLEPRRD